MTVLSQRYLVSVVALGITIFTLAGVPVWAKGTATVNNSGSQHLRIAAVRSAHDLGIIEALVQKFREKNPQITITILSGGVLKVLQQGRNGLADIVLTHHQPAESKFVSEGYSLQRSQIMFTEYALFGPPGDALGIAKLNDIASVFKRLAEAEAEFYVPSPRSGTNMKIEEIWTMAGINPDWIGYENTGASGYATLLQAAEFGTYAVAEMATYLVNKESLEGKIIPLFRDDLNLRNIYSAIVVNPEKVTGVNSTLATVFFDYLVSEEGQDAIRQIGETTFNAAVLEPAAHLDPKFRELRATRSLKMKSQQLQLAVISSVALFTLLVVSFILFIRMRSVQRKHSESQLRNEALLQAQNKIIETNKLLQTEIEERKVTEQRLSEAVSKLNRSENKLKQYHDHLESLVGFRTRELELAVKELQAFSYSVSHDLRSPLRSINGFSHMLMEDYSGLLDIDGKNYLDRIVNATQRMGLLIDGLLQLSRISQQELKIKDINLSDIANEIFSNIKDEIEDRNIIIEIDNDMPSTGDVNLVRIILENIIGNALKYTSKNSETHITIGKTYQNSSLCFYVKDDGVGFDMKYSEKLFGPFQRLHGEDEFKGNGIGLSTVQRIVHRHGGAIWADSKLGEGSVFYFTLASVEPTEQEKHPNKMTAMIN